VEEEEVVLAMMEEDLAEDEEDKEVLAAVGHYILVQYKEKEGIQKKKKKYKPMSGQYQLEARIKRFGKRGETAVTKELDQFNKYGVFEPKHAKDLSEEDKKKVLSSLIFSKGEEERSNKGMLLHQWKPTKRAYCKRRSGGANRRTQISLHNINY
jgi:hypothetical protein